MYERSFAESQEEFFGKQAKYLSSVREELLMKGYDKPMMEHPLVLQSVKNMISEGKVKISAIFPENATTCLDEAAGSGSVKILRTPKELTKGYILFDEWCLTEWDSKRPSAYGPEVMTSCFRKFQLFPYLENLEKIKNDFLREQELLGVN